MKYLAVIIISYLLGNLSWAFILGKLLVKKDVREYGSGNSGATNAIRVFGAKIGVMAFIGDALKGVLAVLIGRAVAGEAGGYLGGAVAGEAGGYLGGAFAVIGHNWPVFLKFKGGKGVASTIGVMLIISPPVTLTCFVIGLGIAFFTRMVSLGSITGLALAPIVVLILIRPFNAFLFFFCLFIVAMSIYRHKENIKRLISGKENKL